VGLPCEQTDGNAIAAAKILVMDSLWAAYPKTLIHTSAKAVVTRRSNGQPEVGHLNIGAAEGMQRSSDADEDGSILPNTQRTDQSK